ncbi:hypothetical protein CHS0354_030616 [Potamilus streckersoni]|uniref:Uncharacterized protein n=1 Tax=Potamilus streckersoni TaxID=2493646 RepID=A0AAE0SDH5_9BIVA|nr:hypothetical protein CHS0354_030616 [Potamilus streckersoni]
MNQDSQKLADLGQHSRGIPPENPVLRETKHSGKEEVSDIFFRSRLQKSLGLAQPGLSENVQRIHLEKNQAPITLVLNKHEMVIPEDEKELKSPESVLRQLLPQKSKVENESGSYSRTLKRKIVSTDADQSRAGKFSSKEKGYHHDFLCQEDGRILSTRAKTSHNYESSSTSERISPTEINIILPTDSKRILPAEQKWISHTYPQMALSSGLKIISPVEVQIQQPIGVQKWNLPQSSEPDFKFQSLKPARVIHIPETTYVSSLYVNKDDALFLQDYDRCAVSWEDAFGNTVEQPITHQTTSAMPCQRDTMATNDVENRHLAGAETIRGCKANNRLSPQNVAPNQECNVASDSRDKSILSSGCNYQMTAECFRDPRRDRPHSYKSSEQMSSTFEDEILNQSGRSTLQRLHDQIIFHLSDPQSSNYGPIHVGSEMRRISADSERDVILYGRDVMAPNTTADVVDHIQPSIPNPPSSVLKEIESGPDLAVVSDWTADNFLDLWDNSELLSQYAAKADISDAELDHITGLGVSHNEVGSFDQPREESPLNCIKATMTNLETSGSTVVKTFPPSDKNVQIDAQTRNQPKATHSRLEGPLESSRIMFKEPSQILVLRELMAQQEAPQEADTEEKADYYSDKKLRIENYRRSLFRDASTQTEPLPVKSVADKCQQIPESSISVQTPTYLEVLEYGVGLFEDLDE